MLMSDFDDFADQMAKWEQERYERLAEIRQQEEAGISDPIINEQVIEEPVSCPVCHSTQITANKKGYSLGRGVAGGVLLGPAGLLGGLIGSNKVVITCLKCGHQWKP